MCKKNIYWCKFKSYQLKEIIDDNTVVVLSVGSCEQHGFHLPLETDTTLVYRIAEEAALKAEKKIFILPPIWTGYSPHHMDFSGSITLRRETLYCLIFDICTSLMHHGIKHILLLNGHGGNEGILRTVVDDFGSKYSTYPILVTYFTFFSKQIKERQRSAEGGMGHAGELETSLQLFLSPDFVDTDRLEGEIIKGNKYFKPGMFINNKIYQYKPFSSYSPIGVIGEPQAALKETGKELFKIMVEGLAKLFDDIADGLVQ
jgi:creatinine amidohydrolase